MPVIAFVSPKGGAGKTTSATLLASQLAISKAQVTVIDADPNKNISEWAQRPGCPENIKIINDVSEEDIIEHIEEASQKTTFVIVDLEGTASLMVGLAISLSDFVILPVQGSHLDARQAVKAIQLIKRQEKAIRRKIHYAVLFTRTNPAITPRTLRHIQDELRQAGVEILKTEITDREAYRAIFSYGGTVEDLAKFNITNLAAAIANARAYAVEVIERLKSISSEKKVAKEHLVDS